MSKDSQQQEPYITPPLGDPRSKGIALRSVDDQAAFLIPHLRAGMILLDCGCGPGTITAGLAKIVEPGAVFAG